MEETKLLAEHESGEKLKNLIVFAKQVRKTMGKSFVAENQLKQAEQLKKVRQHAHVHRSMTVPLSSIRCTLSAFRLSKPTRARAAGRGRFCQSLAMLGTAAAFKIAAATTDSFAAFGMPLPRVPCMTTGDVPRHEPKHEDAVQAGETLSQPPQPCPRHPVATAVAVADHWLCIPAVPLHSRPSPLPPPHHCCPPRVLRAGPSAGPEHCLRSGPFDSVPSVSHCHRPANWCSCAVSRTTQ